jgi:hypothetical protein
MLKFARMSITTSDTLTSAYWGGRGVRSLAGRITTATIISAPSLTENASGTRDSGRVKEDVMESAD